MHRILRLTGHAGENMRTYLVIEFGKAMRAAVVVLGIVLFNVATAKAYTWEPVCDVRADYALGLENYSEAIRLHQEFLASHPGNALAHYHLGFAYGMSGRSEDEIREYEAAVSLGSRDWDLFLNLGIAYLEQNKLVKSIDSLKLGLSIPGEHYELHLDLAIAYERSDRPSEALPEILSALRLNPTDPEVHNIRAAIYAELDDFKRAREEWSHLTHTAPDFLPARNNLDLLDKICDEDADSLRAFEKTGTLAPGKSLIVFCSREHR
jgi:tetratricopeptide (TPR) repeat protein